jgi:hypothetical protein
MYEKHVQFYNMLHHSQESSPFSTTFSLCSEQSHCDNDPESSFERETNVDDGVLGLIFWYLYILLTVLKQMFVQASGLQLKIIGQYTNNTGFVESTLTLQTHEIEF